MTPAAAAAVRAGLLRAGFWGMLLAVAASSLLPAGRLPGAAWILDDRLMHAVAYGCLALLGMAAHPKRLLLVAGGLFALGAGLEGLQAMVPGRGASAADMAANGAGIACALLLARALRWRRGGL